MSTRRFYFYNICFKRKGTGRWIFVNGEITNDSGKDYNTAVFRLSVFGKNILMWAGMIKIVGFRKRQTRNFELMMDGFDHRSLPAIARYDIYFENGY
jgi:hypothetical protein